MRHVAELGGAADEEGPQAREAVEAGGEEQAMDLVELPLAAAVLEEDRDAVRELEGHVLV